MKGVSTERTFVFIVGLVRSRHNLYNGISFIRTKDILVILGGESSEDVRMFVTKSFKLDVYYPQWTSRIISSIKTTSIRLHTPGSKRKTLFEV